MREAPKCQRWDLRVLMIRGAALGRQSIKSLNAYTKPVHLQKINGFRRHSRAYKPAAWRPITCIREAILRATILVPPSAQPIGIGIRAPPSMLLQVGRSSSGMELMYKNSIQRKQRVFRGRSHAKLERLRPRSAGKGSPRTVNLSREVLCNKEKYSSKDLSGLKTNQSKHLPKALREKGWKEYTVKGWVKKQCIRSSRRYNCLQTINLLKAISTAQILTIWLIKWNTTISNFPPNPQKNKEVYKHHSIQIEGHQEFLQILIASRVLLMVVKYQCKNTSVMKEANTNRTSLIGN